MPTRTQQCDLMTCAYASHGDTRHICLYPSDPREAFEFAAKAFDLAERFQTPVFVLSDLDIGMNDWMVPKLSWDDSYRPDRGKVLSAEELEQTKTFARYLDVDGDGIPYRSLPGTHPKGAFFTRGSGHNKFGGYTEIPDEYQEVMDRLLRKHRAAGNAVPEPVIRLQTDATFGIISLGGCDPAVREAVSVLAERGIVADYMRIRAFPFGDNVSKFLASHDRVFVVEQNRDAQLKSLLTLETSVPKDKLHSILVYGGFPLSSRHVVDGITEKLKGVVS